jgi:hypothetical protein
MNQPTKTTIVDKNGREIAAGQRLRVQHCVGRYGQVRVDEGVVEQLDTVYRGVTLRMGHATKREIRGISHFVAAGELFYIALAGEFDGPVYKCMRTHNDFEHGHEAWAEISE